MPGLTYPFVYKCSNCDNVATITRSEAQDVHPNPDSINAHALVLRTRGWMQDEIGALLWCPDCIPSSVPERGDHVRLNTDPTEVGLPPATKQRTSRLIVEETTLTKEGYTLEVRLVGDATFQVSLEHVTPVD